MLDRLRHKLGPIQYVYLQAGLFVLALQTEIAGAWSIAFTLAVPINLWAWLESLRHGRAIRDTPTSRIASAAQGYVELRGVARPTEAGPLVSPVTHLPCLWYRYIVERRSNNKWQFSERGESGLPFDLDDGSGRCTLDPDGARIHSRHKETRQVGDLRHTEWVLLQGDTLYAIGAFDSRRGIEIPLDARRDVGDLLAEWKEDQEALRARFDLDGDGEIDSREWALARQAARREIERRHQAIRDRPPTHTLRRPDNGLPYLIANHPPEILARRFQFWAALFLVLFLGALLGLGWSLGR
jgi:hypothetical protein